MPDIDFNIRAGNTLVGFAHLEDARRVISGGQQQRLLLDDRMASIEARLAGISALFQRFRDLQTTLGGDSHLLADGKRNLREQLMKLSGELDRHLAVEYGIDRRTISNEREYERRFTDWRTKHKPFHWIAEFYQTIAEGGFDAVIGNPPYVDYGKVRDTYTVRNYKTERCGNLYAYVVERSLDVSGPDTRVGMIVPLSLTFSGDFGSLRSMLLQQSTGLLHLSSYDNIPDRLFTGAKESENTSKANQQRITIFLLQRSRVRGKCRVYSSPLLRWKAMERERLFVQMPITDITDICTDRSFPKVGTSRMKFFLKRWQSAPGRLSSIISRYGPHHLVVPKTAGYYIAAYPEEMERTQQTTIHFLNQQDRDLAMVLLNSNAFFWLWRVYGDSFHITMAWIDMCPVFPCQDEQYLDLAKDLRAALPECTVYKGYRGVDVPNVNFNRRMDILWRVDEWIIKHVAPDMDVTPEDFLWAKSNSFLKIDIPRAANFPLSYIRRASASSEE